MYPRLFFALLVLQESALATVSGTETGEEREVGKGTGCEKKLKAICPGWDTESLAKCLACVDKNIDRLKPECTKEQAEKRCRNSPGPTPVPPQPPAPPAPPLKPNPDAPRPHIVLFVVDDQGWANIGYHNPGNVITPNSDALAKEGIKLERHYAYRWCAPSRSSLMTGRLPLHVLETTNYVSRGMTMLPRRLQQVGYNTHQIGKWHLGDTMEWMLPKNRGFNSSLGYLSAAEDHYTQFNKKEMGCGGTDLWQDDGPAYGQNGTYGAYIYNDRITSIVKEHDPSQPLFLYVALQTMHAPQQVPSYYSDMYEGYFEDYKIMNGMATIGDSVLGNLTSALKLRGMWENTLLLHVADNGGPAGQASSGHSGNNWPLRGGKTNNFEGGVRVAAFLTGGFIPTKLRGTERHGYIHNADWFPTLAKLAGAPADDPNTAAPEVPAVDGLDVWPYITGEVSNSPRTEIMLSAEDNGAIISGDLKLILGVQSYGFWQGPRYPNATTDHKSETEFDCKDGCLFNVTADPGEHVDLATQLPAELKMMQSLWAKRNATKFSPPKVPLDTAACEAFRDSHKGFLGPYQTFAQPA